MASDSLNIPLYFASAGKVPGDSIMVIAGDIGGTKCILGLFKATATGVEPVKEITYHSHEFTSSGDLIKRFLDETGQKADRICLGVAGPVINNKVEVTNLTWVVDAAEIQSISGIRQVFLLNDLEATSYGLAALGKDDVITIHEGIADKGNIAVIAPGTGLGEAGLFFDGSAYRPFATEGGHSDFSPRSEQDGHLFLYLQKKYGIVSWEKVIAGPGIHDIFCFLLSQKNQKEPPWLADAMSKNDPSAVISQAALDEKDPLCIETMQIFVRLLARECSNLVLKLKATGGLFLGGGIPPKISPLLQFNVFYNNFLDNDRMQHLVKRIPVRIIRNEKTALLGAAWFGAYTTNQQM